MGSMSLWNVTSVPLVCADTVSGSVMAVAASRRTAQRGAESARTPEQTERIGDFSILTGHLLRYCYCSGMTMLRIYWNTKEEQRLADLFKSLTNFSKTANSVQNSSALCLLQKGGRDINGTPETTTRTHAHEQEIHALAADIGSAADMQHGLAGPALISCLSLYRDRPGRAYSGPRRRTAVAAGQHPAALHRPCQPGQTGGQD